MCVYVCSCAKTRACTCHSLHVEVKRKTLVSFHLLLLEVQGFSWFCFSIVYSRLAGPQASGTIFCLCLSLCSRNTGIIDIISKPSFDLAVGIQTQIHQACSVRVLRSELTLRPHF